jgi:eukaryotic-like serine/threonine-protein kinase
LTEKSWNLSEGEEIAPGRLALAPLGRGNLYETYLAWDDRLFSIVVAKLVRADKVEDPKALRALRGEAEALDRLAHPMLVRSFASILEGPRPHLVLEHLEGPPLHTLIRKYAPLPLEQVLPLALDLCSVLHYLEAEGMVHLDVKPGNVIMAAAPKLVDLSLARTVEAAQRISGAVGTEGYMAPEALDPGVTGRLGPETDVWGLGVTVYEAIVGRPPPEPGKGAPELPREVPPEAADALLRCLEPKASDRPRAADLALALRPAVEQVTGTKVIRRGRPRLH